MAWQAIKATADQMWQWVVQLWPGDAWDAGAWQAATWLALAVALVALLVIVLRLRRGVPASLPEMMVSHGEIVLQDGPASHEGVQYGLAAPAGATHQLTLTLSNLNSWPVQLLELAVRTRGLRQPVVAVAGSVVPPNGAVDVAAELYDLPGDAGVIQLYFYSNRGRRRTYMLSAPLEWQPWDQRYRVRALASKVTPVTTLASQERRQREARSYRWAKRRQRHRELAEGAWRRAEELGRQVRDKRTAATEGRLAGVQPQAWAGTPPLGPAPTAHGAPRAAVLDEAVVAESAAPQVQEEQGARPRMDFPDEF